MRRVNGELEGVVLKVQIVLYLFYHLRDPLSDIYCEIRFSKDQSEELIQPLKEKGKGEWVVNSVWFICIFSLTCK